MKFKLLTTAIMSTVAITGCNLENNSGASISVSAPESQGVLVDSEAQANSIKKNSSPAEVNQAIKDLALEFAKHADADMLASAGRLARSSFGVGEEEILINDLLNNVDSRSVERLGAIQLRTTFAEEDKLRALAEKIPYASLYYFVPENYEGSEDALLVATAQYYEDEEQDYVQAYDLSGNLVILSGTEDPEVPVLVVGISEYQEMLDDQARYLDKKSQEFRVNEIRSVGTVDYEGNQHGTINRNMFLESIYLFDDHDPWNKGKAEPYALWSVAENSSESVRHVYQKMSEKKTYAINAVAFSFSNEPKNMYYKVAFWEKDSNWGVDAKVENGSYTYQGEGFDIRAEFSGYGGFGDKDDHMGDSQMYFYHPRQAYTTGSVKFWARGY